MIDASKFSKELGELEKTLQGARHVLITAPGAADGDSVGSQLALRKMILTRFPNCSVAIINDEPLPPRYRFLPEINSVDTPETFAKNGGLPAFDLGIIVDGGIDRAGRVREVFERCKVTAFVDHHCVSVDFPYTIRLVEPKASSTTELIYYLSQSAVFKTPIDRDFAQQIYLGLIFDTGFFRHSCTTPEAMELAAKLLRTGFDFTRVGERGMLERTYAGLRLLSDTLSRAELSQDGKVIYSVLSLETLRKFQAHDDDREGIIDHLFLTQGIDIALLFIELPDNATKLSLRSHRGRLDVAHFARSLSERGGGHENAAGALLSMSLDESVEMVLKHLQTLLPKKAAN